jgi:hypothetical protein
MSKAPHSSIARACIPKVYASRMRKCEDSRAAGPVPYVDNTSSNRVRRWLYCKVKKP